jgi:Fe-S oxidoreductase
MDRLLGITPARPLPSFARHNLVRWFRRRPAGMRSAPQGQVTFLADSFTTFTEPEIGQAAIELLERAGWRVRLEADGCCGRSSLSKGLLDKAKNDAGAVARHQLQEAAVHAYDAQITLGAPGPGCGRRLRPGHGQ